jgi:hypothetical protein
MLVPRSTTVVATRGKGKTRASRAIFCLEQLRQYVVGKEERGTACPPLRRKLTGELPWWGAGRDRAGQQAGATLVSPATNVAPCQGEQQDRSQANSNMTIS